MHTDITCNTMFFLILAATVSMLLAARIVAYCNRHDTVSVEKALRDERVADWLHLVFLAKRLQQISQRWVELSCQIIEHNLALVQILDESKAADKRLLVLYSQQKAYDNCIVRVPARQVA